MKPKIKINKISTTIPKKAGIILIWVLVVFLLVRGIGSVLHYETSSEIKQKVNGYVAAAQDRETKRAQASAYAENFVYEFYNYAGDPPAFVEKMKPFLAEGVTIMQPDTGFTSKTVWVNTTGVYFTKAGTDVDVVAVIEYNDKTQKKIALRVPIAIKNKQMAVNALPMYISNANHAERIPAAEGLQGTEVDQYVKDQIVVVLNNFFKAYYGGNRNELSYYITKGFPEPQPLGNMVAFEQIKDCTVVMDKNALYIEVNLDVKDANRLQPQHLFLKAIQGKNGKYYLTSIATHFEK